MAEKLGIRMYVLIRIVRSAMGRGACFTLTRWRMALSRRMNLSSVPLMIIMRDMYKRRLILILKREKRRCLCGANHKSDNGKKILANPADSSRNVYDAATGNSYGRSAQMQECR